MAAIIELALAVKRGSGRKVVWRVPENAAIQLADWPTGPHVLAGATITSWVVAE